MYLPWIQMVMSSASRHVKCLLRSFFSLDHAFSIKPLDNGLFEVGVHAVDVASMIRPNTITDREARERAVAVRLVERTVPMLPETFALEHARLIPGKER